MTRRELKKRREEYQDRIKRYIGVNCKSQTPYAMGYYFDKNTNHYKVYEITERQDEIVKFDTQLEIEAVDKLYEMIQHNIRILERNEKMKNDRIKK